MQAEQAKKCPTTEELTSVAEQRYLELRSDTCDELYDFICALEEFLHVKQQTAFKERINKGAERHRAARNALSDGKAFGYEVILAFIEEHKKCLEHRRETKN